MVSERQYRWPDMGVPYSVIRHNSWSEKLLDYALFKTRFTVGEYANFRQGNMPRSTEAIHGAIRKLVRLGYLKGPKRVTGKSTYVLTDEGRDAAYRVARRNALRLDNKMERVIDPSV